MRLLITLLIILALFSCTTPRTRRGSLSGAFEAAEEPGGEVDDGYIWNEPEEDNDSQWADSDNKDNRSSNYSDPLDTSGLFSYYGIESDYQFVYFGDFSRAFSSNLSFGGYADDIGGFLKFGIIWLDTESRTHTYEKYNGGLLGLNAGLEIRKNMTSMKEPVYLELVIDTNLSLMIWSYKNPISSTVTDETGYTYEDSISSDSITMWSLGAGPGICIGKTLFLDSTVGFNLFSPYSNQGFSNDIFHPYLYLKFAAKLMLGSK